MTRHMINGAVVLATLLAAGACSLPPNLVVARDPIPPPPADYKVVCSSFPVPPFKDHISHCRPVAPARIETRTVVRAKG
jgi:hypothetical protein